MYLEVHMAVLLVIYESQRVEFIFYIKILDFL